MFQRRIPEQVRHPSKAGVRSFAVLSGTEAIVRGVLISVMPIAMYRAFQDSSLVSELYFGIGVFSMIWGLFVPWLTRYIPRRWLYTCGVLTYIASAVLAVLGESQMIAVALLMNMMATVTVFICLNAYVLDYVGNKELGRCETLRMFYSAISWTAGPAGGVFLMQWWEPAPFVVAGVAAVILLIVFWWLRLGNGKQISRAKAPALNPLAFLGRFFVQPRLVAGWLFAVFRSCGWWVYVVYLPVYAIESGLGENVGGTALSISNAMLFATPLMLKWAQRRSVRRVVRIGFLFSGLAFVVASGLADFPWLAIAVLMVGVIYLVLLDIYGGLPFLMAVRPPERTEMSAVYSSFRDFSGVLTPGVAWLVLLVFPLSGVFAAAGLGLLASWAIAGRLHPRLGLPKIKLPEPTLPATPAPQTRLE
ncbi:MFS transporter [Rhodovibrionaceae bacterium A322]